MSIELWTRETKESTPWRDIKQGDIFCFFYDKQYYFFGRILAVKGKKYCIAELFDYLSEKPEIDEQTILDAGRLMPPFNIDTTFTFQDKFMKWDWRIIGHQEGFVAPDQDELVITTRNSDQEWIKVDLKGNKTKITEEEASGYIMAFILDPDEKPLREAILQKLRAVNPKPDPSSATEEALFKYANPLFESNMYAEVIDAISAFPEDKMSRRLAGLLIGALNNTKKPDEVIEHLDKYKALFSEDMYRWYCFYGRALEEKKEYEKLQPVIEKGLAECEAAFAAGTLSNNEYLKEKGPFSVMEIRRTQALKEKESCQNINGFVIKNGRMIRYEGDTDLEEIVIPEGIKVVRMSVFDKNKNIKSFVFPEGVEELEPFEGGSNIETFSFPSTLRAIFQRSLENTKWYQDQPKGEIICGKVLYKYTGDEEEVIVEDGIETIGSFAFSCHKNLRKVVLPDSVNFIDSGAFKDCTNLSELVLPKNMDTVFSRAFLNCVSLKEITLPDGMTKLGDHAFAGCVNLREVILPDTIVQLYGGVFEGCKNLERVHLPSMAEGLDYGVENWIPRVEGSFFKGCEKLKEVTIPKNIQKFMEETFSGCTSIQKIVFENPETMLGQNTFGRKAKYPEVLYETSPDLPLHLSDGDIKQYIDLDRLPDDVKAKLFIKRQSKFLAKFWEKSITKNNAKEIAKAIEKLKATKLPAKEKKNAELFFKQYGELL